MRLNCCALFCFNSEEKISKMGTAMVEKSMGGDIKEKRPTRDNVTPVGSTKWLALNTIDYTDAEGAKRKWDYATRTTKRNMDKADAAVIVPILRSKLSRTVETILVEQYRPPIDQFTLEFPAGLIDDGEDAATSALRELKEETGYVGTVNEDFQSMMLCMSPGLCDEAIKIVVVDVDMDLEENKNPKQCLEEGEHITLKRVELFDGLKELMQKETTKMPISLLYSFALGLEIGRKR